MNRRPLPGKLRLAGTYSHELRRRTRDTQSIALALLAMTIVSKLGPTGIKPVVPPVFSPHPGGPAGISIAVTTQS